MKWDNECVGNRREIISRREIVGKSSRETVRSMIPKYIRPSTVGRACRMSQRRARRMLDNAGILERIGRCYVVGESRLHERLPEVYDAVYEYLEFDISNSQHINKFSRI